MPIVCAALDYQGGDSGQITSGGWGGEVKCLSGSCSPYKNRKLVFMFQVLFVCSDGSCSLYKNRKLVLKFRVLFVFKFSVLRKAGKTTRKMGLAGRARRVKAGCDLTASMPLRSFGEAFYHRCSFARKMRRCRCRWCYLYLLILLSARYDFGGFGDVWFLHLLLVCVIFKHWTGNKKQQVGFIFYLFVYLHVNCWYSAVYLFIWLFICLCLLFIS